MPASPRSLSLTAAYRIALLRIRALVVRDVALAWRAVDLQNLDGTFPVWLTAAAARLAVAQAQGIRITDAYLTQFLASETGDPTARTSPPINPALYAGATRDGRPLPRLLIPSLFTVKVGIERGLPPAAASQLGLNRAIRNTSLEVMEAPRHALADAMDAEPRIRGWRRVTSGRPCGACMAAATGAIRRTSEVPPTHAGCACTAEPVLDGIPDRISRPTGQQLFDSLSESEQDRLFAGRGGTEKADVVRREGVRVLASSSPTARGADLLTEAPLADLTTP